MPDRFRNGTIAEVEDGTVEPTRFHASGNMQPRELRPMISFFSLLSKEAAAPSAPPMDATRNWRCELGTFWQDIEDAGSIVRAIRLRNPEPSARDRNDDVKAMAACEDAKTANPWTHLRTLYISIL
jgi:hypothetical protein